MHDTDLSYTDLVIILELLAQREAHVLWSPAVDTNVPTLALGEKVADGVQDVTVVGEHKRLGALFDDIFQVLQDPGQLGLGCGE